MATHGLSDTRIYSVYRSMKARCHISSDTSYSYYGLKGVAVFDEWRNDFMSFYNWSMDNGYDDDLTIDRKDSNGNYEPDNCQWITMHENILNQERNSNRSKEDLFIYDTATSDFRVCVAKGAKKNRKRLYSETFYNKEDAIKARDLFLEVGEETRHKKHELGTSEKADISGSIKRKERERKRKLHRLNKKVGHSE